MKIISVNTPAFKWNDKVYAVKTQKLESCENPFNQMQKILHKKEAEGYTHCFIFWMSSNPHEIERDSYDDIENIPLLVKWKFAKIEINNEIKLGSNIKRIEAILREPNTNEDALNKIRDIIKRSFNK